MKTNLKLLKQLMTMKQDKLHKILHKYLTMHYDNIIATKDYLIAVGDIPIALVAHLDTVHKIQPYNFFHDYKKNVLWSPQGLGADDRAGVYAILQIIEAGYRPHVIFCKDEEIGGLGAISLITDFPEAPFDNLKFIIELDRGGDLDCVFYDCMNEDFNKMIASYNFIYDEGSFSDISVIAPVWKVAAVNLSVGYEYEHTLSEYLKINSLEATIQKVKNILQDEPQLLNYSFIPRLYRNQQDSECIYCRKKIKKREGIRCFSYKFNFAYDCCIQCYNNNEEL